jgi:hypothetical protein
VRLPSSPSLALAAALVALAASSAGCFTTNGASANAMPVVRVQASSDLDCPQKDLRVVQSWGGQFDVVGCGHKATYNTSCEGLRCVVAPEGQTVPWRARPDPTPTP